MIVHRMNLVAIGSKSLKPVHEKRIAEVPLAIFDLETTGRSYQKHDIVEASVVRIEPGEKPHIVFDSLIKPVGRMGASDIHHIYDEDVRDAPTFEQIAPQLAHALSGAIWVAYNVSFDLHCVNCNFTYRAQHANTTIL